METLHVGNFLLLMDEYHRISSGRSTTCVSFPHVCRLLNQHILAPEYALDEQLVTASDMYSLGCLVYAVHKKGDPPFRNHGSVSGLRDNSTKPVPGLDGLDPDLQGEHIFVCLSSQSKHSLSHFSTSTIHGHSTLWFTANS